MNKPRIRLYASWRGKPEIKFLCSGSIRCPVSGRPILGYGYGFTVEQAYSNWLHSPIPF